MSKGLLSYIGKELTAFELLVTWGYVAVSVVYLYSVLIMLIRPSIVSNLLPLKITLIVMSVIAQVLLLLNYMEKISEYALLVVMIVYITAYTIGLIYVRRKKKQIDEESARLLKISLQKREEERKKKELQRNNELNKPPNN